MPGAARRGSTASSSRCYGTHVRIFIDADACPVKEETYKVALRYGVSVAVVANSRMRVPDLVGIELVVVAQGPDVADDWIVETLQSGDVVVTADIPLAARCIDGGARVIGISGRVFTEDSIGGSLATRDLMQHLRESGVQTPGPPPISKKDRSRFSSKLNELVDQGSRGAASR